ncbi:MAG: zinc-ribbon domain-containing protein [Oscillospiraceae bacterium]|nr:zinc-ribbon domain-containing protein [Oscillospiraceae bacterium]
MQEYTDIRTTPLKFHKFFWKIWIPVQVILGGWKFGTLTADFSALDVYTAIDAVYYLLSGVLFAAAMGGFFRWKRSALVSVFLQMAANIIYVLILFFLSCTHLPNAANLAFGSVAGTFIRCILVGIYYYKRRRLFVKGGYTREQMQAINSGADNSFSGSLLQNSGNTQQNHTYSGETPFCPHCGKQLAKSTNFCIYCGSRLK